MIPLLRVIVTDNKNNSSNSNSILNDFDLVVDRDSIDSSESNSNSKEKGSFVDSILQLIVKNASADYTPKLNENSEFQIARGVLGISM